MYRNHPEVLGWFYFFALNKLKTIQFYYRPLIIEISISSLSPYQKIKWFGINFSQ